MAKVKWTLDPAHSEITFKVKHLMISTVTGQFRKFDVTAESGGEDFSTPYTVTVRVDTGSVDTNNEQRDNHLRSADFFNAGEYPELAFTSTRYEGDGNGGKLYGNLTIRNNTKEVALDVEAGGIAADAYGQIKAGFTVSGKISRKAFGLTWDAVTETGSIVVADDIKFHGEIQLVKQA